MPIAHDTEYAASPEARRETVSSWRVRIDASAGLSIGWQVVVFVLVMLLIFSRSPSMFLHAQFFAEDGKSWYADAYNHGLLRSLLMPQVGYYSVAERMGACLSLLVPFRWAPLMMTLVGAVFQWLPAGILLSSRCRGWASLTLRVVFAVLYVAIPNASEIHVVLTNSMWHLALAAVLLGFAKPPNGWIGCVFDCALFLLFSFSGPCGILLLPLLVVFWWLRRERWTLAVIACVGLGAAAQMVSLLHNQGSRAEHYLGATPALLVRIVGGDIFEAVLLGPHAFGNHGRLVVHLAVFLFGLGVLLYVLRMGTLELKLFIVYAAMLLAVSLRSPLVPDTLPLWQVVAGAHSLRYYFFPALAFVWSAAWCAFYGQRKTARYAGRLVLLVMCIGIVVDWHYRAFPDRHFAAYVNELEHAAAGEHVIIPIEPTPWQMELIKHEDSDKRIR